MSAAVMPSQMDMSEFMNQNHRNSNACRTQSGFDRRHFGMATTYSQSRHRNLSGPSGTCSTTPRPPLDNRVLATPPPGVPGNTSGSGYSFRESNHCVSSSRDSNTSLGSINGSSIGSSSNGQHRKLDRSLSDCEHDRVNGNSGANNGGSSGRGVNSARYKTELCRPFEESGHCKYGDKCQFAHGMHELRNLSRHPKYKTEKCRTYHTIGFCPYGPRCHFIHNEDERVMGKPPQTPTPSCSSHSQRILPPSISSTCTSGTVVAPLAQRPSNLCGLSSLGSSFESVSPPSSSTSSSPGNLSPTFMSEDMLPSVALSPASSSSPLHHQHQSSSPTHSQDSSFSGSNRSSPVFNFPASDTTPGVASLLTPLNVQTQQFYNNVVDMAAMQFSTMRLSQNQRNNCSLSANLNLTASMAARATQGLESTDNAVAELASGLPNLWSNGTDISEYVSVPQPPASPVSLSDDSMGSTGSLDSSTSSFSPLNMYNSPLDLGKSLRLPIFNKLSE